MVYPQNVDVVRSEQLFLGGQEIGVGFPIDKMPARARNALPQWMLRHISATLKPENVARWAFGAQMWMIGYGRLPEYGLFPVTKTADTADPPASLAPLTDPNSPFWSQTEQRKKDRAYALAHPYFWRTQTSSNAFEDAVSSVVDVVEDVSGIVIDAATAPAKLALAIASGQRIDKALLDAAKNQLKIIKEAAPYAQAVIAVVPGVGTGVSAAISAGAAIAEGKPIDEIVKDAVRGAIPGGAIAAAGFDAALKVAAGGNVLESTLSVAREALPSDAAKKAFDIGLAVATGENVQKTFTNALVSSIGGGVAQDVMKAGLYSMLANQPLAAGLKNIPLGTVMEQGYKLAAGLLAAKGINEKSMTEARKNLNGEALQGFDAALKTQEARTPWVKTVLSTPLPAKAPTLKAVTPRAPPAPPKPPTLKAVTPKAAPAKPATPASGAPPPGKKYGPYPQHGAAHGLGWSSDNKWRWFTVYANGLPFVQRGPLWLSDYDAQSEAAGYYEAAQGRGYIGTVQRWDWDPSARSWRRAS